MKEWQRVLINEKRVYRRLAFPVSAFDALQRLKREWRLETNAAVLTRLLLGFGNEREAQGR